MEVPCLFEDLSGKSEADRTKRLTQAARMEKKKPFDLTRELFYRMTLYRLDSNKHLLLLCVHHIGHDGWSHQVFIEDLFTVYKTIIRGGNRQLPPPLQYVDFVHWQNERLKDGSLEAQRTYWLEQLGQSVEAPRVPHDTDISVEEQDPSDIRVHSLKPELVQSLNELTSRAGGTTYMTVLAALKIWLGVTFRSKDDYHRFHTVRAHTSRFGRHSRTLYQPGRDAHRFVGKSDAYASAGASSGNGGCSI